MNNADYIYARLINLANRKGIIVVDDYIDPSNKILLLKSLYILILPGDPNVSFFRVIVLKPKLSIENKIQSLAVNLGCFVLKTSQPYPNLKNLCVVNQGGDRAEIWCEELKGIRDEWPDRFGKRLIAFLNSKNSLCVAEKEGAVYATQT
jgi:hypothetical protein